MTDKDEALVFAMGELNQRTGQVMDEIQKDERPAYITNYGRFIAKIIPIDPAKVRSAVKAAVAQDTGQNQDPPSGEAPLVYTMRDLNQRTGSIMEQIQMSQQPAYITKRGKLIAKVIALEPGEIESAVLAAMAREFGQQ
jgi:antitoxin (DNA-binding transcriptional repressor) of toxin-antitoxin stability system